VEVSPPYGVFDLVEELPWRASLGRYVYYLVLCLIHLRIVHTTQRRAAASATSPGGSQFAIDHTGSIWVASLSGLDQYDPARWAGTLPEKDGLPRQQPSARSRGFRWVSVAGDERRLAHFDSTP